MPFCEILLDDRPVMSSPLKTMRPLVGRSTPVRQLKKVLLPAPFGPMMACVLPRCDLEIDVRQRRKAAETDRKQFRLEDRSRSRSPAYRRGAYVDDVPRGLREENLQAGGTIVLSFGTVSLSL